MQHGLAFYLINNAGMVFGIFEFYASQLYVVIAIQNASAVMVELVWFESAGNESDHERDKEDCSKCFCQCCGNCTRPLLAMLLAMLRAMCGTCGHSYKFFLTRLQLPLFRTTVASVLGLRVVLWFNNCSSAKDCAFEYQFFLALASMLVGLMLAVSAFGPLCVAAYMGITKAWRGVFEFSNDICNIHILKYYAITYNESLSEY